MKMMRFCLVLFATALAMSCQDGVKKQEGDSAPKEGAVNKNFKVSLLVNVQENDDFCLLYTQDGSMDFQEGIWKAVQGSQADQTVEFNFTENVFPSQLRLDFGRNKSQKDIILKSITLEHEGNQKVLSGPGLANYFRADENKCTFDPATGVITALVKNGERQSPSLYPHPENVRMEIEKLGQ